MKRQAAIDRARAPASRHGVVVAALRVVALLVLWLAVAGCGRQRDATRGLVVFAASSLTEAMNELARRFEAAHPELDVVLSVAGSQALRLQIEHGAPADVFASANVEHVEALEAAGLLSHAAPLAVGELAVVVPDGNPARLETAQDLPRAHRIVLGTEHVPVGAYARRMLDRADAHYGAGFRERVEARVVSMEPNVRLVLAKVELGEADAAIVYRSDAATSRAVHVIPLPPELQVRAEYRIGVPSAAPHPDDARRFIKAASSPDGASIFARHGFGPVGGE